MKKFRQFAIKNFEVIRVLFAIFLSLVVITVVVACVSTKPREVLYWFTVGPTTNLRRFGTVIELMIPLSFCGLAMCMMFQADRFNLVGDGVFYIAGSVAAILALKCNLPPIVFPFFIILMAAVVGGAIAAVPAVINVKYDSNIVVASIMLNYVLLYLGRFVLIRWLKEPTFAYNGTPFFSDNAVLTRIVEGTRIHTGLIILVIATVVIHVLVFKTKLGYAIRISGKSPEFARYCGISTNKYIVLSQFIGGCMAGIGGAVEVLGIYRQLNWEALLGYGFDGMLIAIIAKNKPLVVPVVAIFLAYVRAGADLVNRMTDVPVELVKVIQAVVIILVAANALLSGCNHKLILREAEEEKKK